MKQINVFNDAQQNSNPESGAKKKLLNLTAYLAILAAAFPLVFTAAVFLGTASTGNLGNSISQVLLG
ncbi:MAG: hypothetical protein OQK32_03205 [Gammaproteobacteria bacterium]|nr:hypothetical protein [Gammaproteobacteria bacterium]MCW8923167.1 hypothetical protein [Gammaproteobacteria bacterium]